jgi:hypothetical protein
VNQIGGGSETGTRTETETRTETRTEAEAGSLRKALLSKAVLQIL